MRPRVRTGRPCESVVILVTPLSLLTDSARRRPVCHAGAARSHRDVCDDHGGRPPTNGFGQDGRSGEGTFGMVNPISPDCAPRDGRMSLAQYLSSVTTIT